MTWALAFFIFSLFCIFPRALIDALSVSSAIFDARIVAGRKLGSWREARPETRFDADSEGRREVYVDTGTDDAGVGPADMHRSPWMIRGIEPRAGMSASVTLKTCPALETKEQSPEAPRRYPYPD